MRGDASETRFEIARHKPFRYNFYSRVAGAEISGTNGCLEYSQIIIRNSTTHACKNTLKAAGRWLYAFLGWKRNKCRTDPWCLRTPPPVEWPDDKLDPSGSQPLLIEVQNYILWSFKPIFIEALLLSHTSPLLHMEDTYSYCCFIDSEMEVHVGTLWMVTSFQRSLL